MIKEFKHDKTYWFITNNDKCIERCNVLNEEHYGYWIKCLDSSGSQGVESDRIFDSKSEALSWLEKHIIQQRIEMFSNFHSKEDVVKELYSCYQQYTNFGSPDVEVMSKLIKMYLDIEV